jgi:photosystem II stability/assembly factor-like uncharacterized protein
MFRSHDPRLLLAGALVLSVGCARRGTATGPAPAMQPVLEPQRSGTNALLQAVSAPSERVAWVSGHSAMVLRTADGGDSWARLIVPGAGADSLQFRDIHAVDTRVAYLLAAGPGERSRIYKTSDGGATWQLQFKNVDSSAFYDCFAFWSASRGLAFSDAVNGHFVVRVTEDGGAHWTPVPATALPPAQRGEGGFAASGACVAAWDGGTAWIGTGAADTARVLATSDSGRTWSAVATPIPGGSFAGIAAIVFRDSLHGVALGGELGDPSASSDNVAITDDGGRAWRLGGQPTFSGAVYGAAVVPGQTGMVFAVGPNGLDYSTDDGENWTRLDTLAYWSVAFGSRTVGWAVGPGGRVVRIRLTPAVPSRAVRVGPP